MLPNGLGKKSLLATALISAMAVTGTASAKVTDTDILNDQATTNDVVTNGMGHRGQRFSPLAKLNTETVKDLKAVWSFSFGGEKQRGQETQALVHDGVIYVTASYSRIFAIDAKSGQKLWSYSKRLPDDIRPCCDVVNRGAAIFGDMIYFGTLDASIVALRPASQRR